MINDIVGPLADLFSPAHIQLVLKINFFFAEMGRKIRFIQIRGLLLYDHCFDALQQTFFGEV
jgi:hypothetical protein